jgi:hypothetical protein
MVEQVGCRVSRIDMRRIEIPGGGREQIDVTLSHGMRKARGVTQSDFVEGPVFQDFIVGDAKMEVRHTKSRVC